MEQALFKRLEAFTRLSEADRSAFGRLKSRTIDVAARRDVIREGDEPTHVNLVLKGWACRYKMLPDGRRSMVGFLIPGDFCDLNVYILKEMDHSIGAVTNVRVAQVAPDDLLQLMNDHPRVAQALLWHELVAAAVQREWTHNLSSRDAYERLAHLLLEMFLRMRTVDLVRGKSCDFPLTQNDLAEAMGLTSVHVNRTLQALRSDDLIILNNRQLTIPDLNRLIDAAMFNPNYLHLDHEGAHLDANA